MKYEGIKFEVKEYDEFPFKKDNDEVVKVCEDLETAQFESSWYSNRARMGEKYYVMDNPHEWVKAPLKLEMDWARALKLCGLK